MSNTETGLDLQALGRLAAELSVSTGVSYHEAMGGLLAATMMAERLDAAEAKLAKIREIVDKARERHLDIISIRTEDLVRILDGEPQP